MELYERMRNRITDHQVWRSGRRDKVIADWADEVAEIIAEKNALLDALVHSGYNPEDCIDCGGPPHNEYCRFWKVRHLLPFDMDS